MTAPALSPRTAALTITAHGNPITQGSKTKSRWGMYDDNAKTLKPWRKIVRAAAEAAREQAGLDPLDGPLAVEVTFTMRKPKSAPKRRITWPIARGKGDVDKLCRAAFDSLTDAQVWGDDVQVVEVTARKVYPGEGIDALDQPGMVLHVWPLPAAEVPW